MNMNHIQPFVSNKNQLIRDRIIYLWKNGSLPAQIVKFLNSDGANITIHFVNQTIDCFKGRPQMQGPSPWIRG